jgi:hypothetical protein
MPRKKKEIQEPILHDLVHRGEIPEATPIPTEVQEPTTTTLEHKLEIPVNIENITKDSVTIDGVTITAEDVANSKKPMKDGAKFPDILERKEAMFKKLEEAKSDPSVTPEEIDKIEKSKLLIEEAFNMSLPAKLNFIPNRKFKRTLLGNPKKLKQFEDEVYLAIFKLYNKAFFSFDIIKQSIYDSLDKKCTKDEIDLFYINYLQFIYTNKERYDLINTSLFLFHKLSVGRLTKVSVGSIISESNRAFFAEQRDLIIKEIKNNKNK